ncbi:MAG: hypothetical protein AAF485_22890, partial [Chloroflexota bacterium]
PAMQALTWDLDAPNQRLTNFLSDQEIQHLDLLPIFRDAAADPQALPLHFRYDQHWTEAGHQLAAGSLHKFLLEQGLVEE